MAGRQLAAQMAGRTPFRCGRRDPAQASNSVRFDFLDPSSFPFSLCGIDRAFLLRPPQLARGRARLWTIHNRDAAGRNLAAAIEPDLERLIGRHATPFAQFAARCAPCGNGWPKTRLAVNKTVTAKA